MAVKKSRKKIIVIIIVALLVLGGAAAYYGISTGFFAQQSKGADSSLTTGATYKENLTQKQTQVDTLLTTGGEQSIQQAEEIADEQVTIAEQSGNDAYIVDASIQKAGILIQTGQAQLALDSILFPLNEKYESNVTYKYDIYECMSWAYRVMGDETTAEAYFNKIP